MDKEIIKNIVIKQGNKNYDFCEENNEEDKKQDNEEFKEEYNEEDKKQDNEEFKEEYNEEDKKQDNDKFKEENNENNKIYDIVKNTDIYDRIYEEQYDNEDPDESYKKKNIVLIKNEIDQISFNNKTIHLTKKFINEYIDNEEILNKNYDDISYKFLDNLDKIDVSNFKFPSREFNCVFAGGGFKGYYLFGASIFLRNMLKNGQIKILNYSGVSIGALALVFLIADIPIHSARNIYEYARFNKKIELIKIIKKVCYKYFPENIHELCNGKLKILVSESSYKGMNPIYIDNFESKEHLISILQATCYIPLFTTNKIRGIKINNKYYFDGAFTNNTPIDESCNIPQLVFYTNNVEYANNYIFKSIDKCPELLIYRGAIEMEQFIIYLNNNDPNIKNLPIEWIVNGNRKKKIYEKMFKIILLLIGHIICLTLSVTDYVNNFRIKK